MSPACARHPLVQRRASTSPAAAAAAVGSAAMWTWSWARMRPLRSPLRSRPLLTRRQRATLRRPRSSSQQRRPPRRCECGPSVAAGGALSPCRSPTHTCKRTTQHHCAPFIYRYVFLSFCSCSLLPSALSLAVPTPHPSLLLCPVSVPSTSLGVRSTVNKGSHSLPNQWRCSLKASQGLSASWFQGQLPAAALPSKLSTTQELCHACT